MALASAFKLLDQTRRRKAFHILITATGSYTAGGDILDLGATTNPNQLGAVQASGIPTVSELIYVPGGYAAEYIPGATLALGKMKVWSAAGTELAAGAYPALLLGAPWEWKFTSVLWAT